MGLYVHTWWDLLTLPHCIFVTQMHEHWLSISPRSPSFSRLDGSGARRLQPRLLDLLNKHIDQEPTLLGTQDSVILPWAALSSWIGSVLASTLSQVVAADARVTERHIDVGSINGSVRNHFAFADDVRSILVWGASYQLYGWTSSGAICSSMRVWHWYQHRY